MEVSPGGARAAAEAPTSAIRREAEELVKGGGKVGGVEAKSPTPTPQPQKPLERSPRPSGGVGPEEVRIDLGPRGVQRLRQAVREAVEEGKAQKAPQGPQGQPPQGGQSPPAPPKQVQTLQNKSPPQIPPDAPERNCAAASPPESTPYA